MGVTFLRGLPQSEWKQRCQFSIVAREIFTLCKEMGSDPETLFVTHRFASYLRAKHLKRCQGFIRDSVLQNVWLFSVRRNGLQ